MNVQEETTKHELDTQQALRKDKIETCSYNEMLFQSSRGTHMLI